MITDHIIPRFYQQRAIDAIVHSLLKAAPGYHLPLAAPTGTGKSLIALAAQEILNVVHGQRCYITTPRVEIILGMFDKKGVEDASYAGQARLEAMMRTHRIMTPMTLHNRLMSGDLTDDMPTHLIVDEFHHDGGSVDTYEKIDLLLGFPPKAGLTASPYRGTAKQTKEMYEKWGEPIWVITYGEAVEEGYLSFPQCQTTPLVDDDLISIQNGEFVVSQVDTQTRNSFEAIETLINTYIDPETKRFDRPTMLTFPGTECAKAFVHSYCKGHVALITQETPRKLRQIIFESVIQGIVALVHIDVVSEGVDLPLRRHIDLSPTLSPVRFVQRFGRITRVVKEGEPAPEYICTNRNLLRHGYLLSDCLPSSVMKEAFEVFTPSVRGIGNRVLGLEQIGRLQAVPVPFLHNMRGEMYIVERPDDNKIHRIAAIVHPLHETVVWAEKIDIKSRYNEHEGRWEMAWGTWKRIDPPKDLNGFYSAKSGDVTPAQKKKWQAGARRVGLDPNAQINRKNCAAFFVLRDIGQRFRTV